MLVAGLVGWELSARRDGGMWLSAQSAVLFVLYDLGRL